MNCQRCQSNRVVNISAKSSDLNFISLGDKVLDGYVPDDMGIGGGDYIELDYCLNCGQIQGTFPLPETELEQVESDDEIEVPVPISELAKEFRVTEAEMRDILKDWPGYKDELS